MKNRMPRRKSSVKVPKRALRRGRKFEPMMVALRTVAGSTGKTHPQRVAQLPPALKDPMRTLGHPPRPRQHQRRQ